MAVGCFHAFSTDAESWERLHREGRVNTGPVEAINCAPYLFTREPVFDHTCESPDIDWLGINKEFS